MSKRCKTCEAHEKAYRLYDEDPRVGARALETTLETFFEHLRDLETETYKQAMESILKGPRKDRRSSASFLDHYAEHLRKAIDERGCNVELAKIELRSWLPYGDRDYSGIRVGLSLLEPQSEPLAEEPEKKALSA